MQCIKSASEFFFFSYFVSFLKFQNPFYRISEQISLQRTMLLWLIPVQRGIRVRKPPPLWCVRSIYMASKPRKRSPPPPPPVSTKLFDWQKQESRKQQKQLQEQLAKIQKYSSQLQTYIARMDQKKAEEKAIPKDLALDRPADEKDIATVEEFLSLPEDEVAPAGKERPSLFATASSTLSLPAEITERLGTAVVNISSKNPKDQNWGAIVKALYYGNGLTGLNVGHANTLIRNIPLGQRSNLMPIIHEMMSEANIEPSKLTLDLTMAAYAHEGHTTVVEAFLQEMQQRGFEPTHYSYAHLLKSLGKNNDLERSSAVLKEMQQRGISPSFKTVTTLLQTCIRVKDYNQAFDLFDMLKFLSTETQPDIRVYNSLLLAAAKRNRIEKVLDLYKELTTRPTDPLQPNAETYNTLVYACAKDSRTHLLGWKFLLEMQSKRCVADRKAMNSLLYLCGKSGEIMFARMLFKQLCANEATYPDSFMLNCLFNAYSKFSPGYVSPVMTSALGPQIRSSFLFMPDQGTSLGKKLPPFLPLTILTSREQVLAESRAILQYYKTHRLELITERSIYGYLGVAFELKDVEEFKRRYNEETFFDSDSNSPGVIGETDLIVHSSVGVPRTKYSFELAMKAAVRGADLAFGSEVWAERGKWRHSKAFQKLSRKERIESDFHFAREMVSLLALCGETKEALNIIKSTVNQFEWRKHHVPILIEKAVKTEDTVLQDNIASVLKFYKRRHEAFSEFYEHNRTNPRARI